MNRFNFRAWLQQLFARKWGVRAERERTPPLDLFTLENREQPGSVLSELGLAADTGRFGNDFITSSSTVSGRLTGDTAGGQVVRFDWNGDGVADGSTTAAADGTFSFTPVGLGAGQHEVRAWVGSDALASTASDDIFTLAFGLYDPAADAPQVAGLSLANDTGAAGDFVTDDAGITGQLAGTSAPNATVEIDWTGDGVADASTTADADGRFMFAPQGLTDGGQTVQVRAAGQNQGWSSLSFVLDSAPNSAESVARAAALDAVRGAGGFGNLDALLPAVTRASNAVASGTTAADAAGRQQADGLIGTARGQYDAAVASADVTLANATAQARAGLIASGAADASWFSFGQLVWPDAPNVAGAPVLSWSGPTPDAPPVDLGGPDVDSYFKPTFTPTYATEKQALETAHATNQSNILGTFRTKDTEAKASFNEQSTLAQQHYQYLLTQAQSHYDQLAGMGAAGLTTFDALIQQATVARDGAYTLADVERDQSVAAADQAHQTRLTELNATWAADNVSAYLTYWAALQQAQQAYDSERAAAEAERNQSSGGGGPGTPGSPGSGAVGEGSAAQQRYEQRMAAAERARKLAVAGADKVLRDRLADITRAYTVGKSSADKTKSDAVTAADHLRDQKKGAAQHAHDGVVKTSTASKEDVKFQAKMVHERAKAHARAWLDRRLAQLGLDQAIAVADADQERDVALATARKAHAVDMATLRLSHYRPRTFVEIWTPWEDYQGALIVREKAWVEEVAAASLVLATAEAGETKRLGHLAAARAKATAVEHVDVDLQEMEERITAQQDYHTVAHPKKVELAWSTPGLMFQTLDRFNDLNAEYQRGNSKAVEVSAVETADAQQTFAKAVAAAEHEFAVAVAAAGPNDPLDQAQATRAQRIADATEVLNQASLATRIKLGEAQITLDDTKQTSEVTIRSAQKLAQVNTEHGLVTLIAAEAVRMEARMAKAGANATVKRTVADGHFEVAKADAAEAGVEFISLARKAAHVREVTAEGDLKVAQAHARKRFETDVLDAHVKAVEDWSARGGYPANPPPSDPQLATPTAWTRYQVAVAKNHRDQIVAAANARVLMELETAAAHKVWAVAIATSESAHEVAVAKNDLAFTRANDSAKVSQAQQLGAAQTQATTSVADARSVFESATLAAEKTEKERQEKADKAARVKILQADILYQLAVNATLGTAALLGAWEARRDAIAEAERVKAHELVDAHTEKVGRLADARAAFTVAAGGHAQAAADTVRGVNQATAVVLEVARRQAGRALATADKTQTDELADANFTRDVAVAAAVKAFGVSVADGQYHARVRDAAAVRTFLDANVSEYETRVNDWPGAANSPQAVAYYRQLVTAFRGWAGAVGGVRTTFMTASATAAKAATTSQLNAAFALAETKATEQKTAEKQAAAVQLTAREKTADEEAKVERTAAHADAQHQSDVQAAQKVFDEVVVTADAVYDKAVATAQARYAHQEINAQTRRVKEPGWTGYEAELESARRQLYNPAIADSLTSARKARVQAVADARVAWAETMAWHDFGAVEAVVQVREQSSDVVAKARKVMSKGIADAETARRNAISDKEAATQKLFSQAAKDQEYADADAAKQLAVDLGIPNAELARAFATAEADFHIAVARAAEVVAVATAAQLQTEASRVAARDAKLRADWLTVVKPDHVAHQVALEAADQVQRVSEATAEDVAAKAVADATKTHSDAVTDAQVAMDKAIAAKEVATMAAEEGLQADFTTAAAEAKSPWFRDMSDRAGGYAVRVSKAKRAHEVEVTAAFATWQGGELTPAANEAWQAANTAAQARLDEELTAAAAARTAGEAALEAGHTTALRTAASTLQRERAGLAKALRVEQANQGKMAALAGVTADKTLTLALDDAHAVQAKSDADGEKAWVVAAAVADWDFFAATTSRAVPLMSGYAADVNTPYAAYLADRVAAEANWRAANKQPYVAYQTALAELERSRVHAVVDAELVGAESYSRVVADADATLETALVNTDHARELQLAEADYQYTLELISVVSPYPYSGIAVGYAWAGTMINLSVITAVMTPARRAWAAATAAANRGADMAAVNAGFTHTLALVSQEAKLAVAEVTAGSTAELAGVVTEADYARTADASYADAIESFAVATPSVWATRDAVVARADATHTTVVMNQWQVSATTKIVTERDRLLAEVGRAKDAAVRTAGLDWVKEVALIHARFLQGLAANPSLSLGAVPAVEAPEKPGGRAESGPGERAGGQGLFAKYGYHGDGYYRGFSGRLSQTHSVLDWAYYTQQWSDWTRQAEAAGYDNPFDWFKGEHISRPLYGDYLLTTGDTRHVDWVSAVFLPGRWVSGFVVEQVQDLRQAMFDAGTRWVFIQTLKLQGDFAEASRQETALLLGILVESQYSPIQLFNFVSGVVGFVAGDEYGAMFDLKATLSRVGNALHDGAFADGKQGAKVVDFVADIAIDVVTEVLTAGTYTPVLVAKRAAKAGVQVAETGGKALAKVVKAVGSHADDAAKVAKAAVGKADDVARAARRSGAAAADAAGDAAQAAKKPVKGLMARLERIGQWAHDKLQPLVKHVVHDWLGNTKLHKPLTELAHKLGFEACFPAGTPLLVPGGSRMIEDLRAGDVVLSRDEYDPAGDIGPKVVEEVFVREALVWEVRLGGQVIRTTAEHPFWVDGQGWVAVNRLQPGVRLLSHDGTWVTLEGVRDTGAWERVYNLRVADYHTYFVGQEEWGFAAWAHNAHYDLPNGASWRQAWRKFLQEAKRMGLDQQYTKKELRWIWHKVVKPTLRSAKNGTVKTGENVLREVDGILHTLQAAKQRGWTLVRANLHYGHNEGIDLVFKRLNARGKFVYSVWEAKASAAYDAFGNFLLKVKGPGADGLYQSTNRWILSRLRGYFKDGDGVHNRLARSLQKQARRGRVQSFLTSEASQQSFHIPRTYPKLPEIPI